MKGVTCTKISVLTFFCATPAPIALLGALNHRLKSAAAMLDLTDKTKLHALLTQRFWVGVSFS